MHELIQTILYRVLLQLKTPNWQTFQGVAFQQDGPSLLFSDKIPNRQVTECKALTTCSEKFSAKGHKYILSILLIIKFAAVFGSAKRIVVDRAIHLNEVVFNSPFVNPGDMIGSEID